MKRITLLLMAVALLAGGAGMKSQAQDLSKRHVYFSEGFSGEGTRYDTAVWNMAVDTTLRLFYSMGTETGCPAPEAVIGYYPDYGLKDILSDTVRLVSKPFDLQKASRAYVSMKYTYKAVRKGSDDGMRSFGLAARQPGGDWMPCGIVGNGGLEQTMGPARLSGELPAALKDAPAVEVCVYLQNRMDFGEMKNYFLLYFDDIEFFAYPEAYYDAVFSWEGQPYVFIGDEADGLSVSLKMENAGNTLTSGKIAYTFDGGEPQYIDLTPGAPLLPGQTYTVSSFEPAGWAQAAEGHHTLVFWLAEANGTALAETAIVKHRKILSKLAPATVTTYPYRPLVEEFSSSSCNTCAPRNKALQPIFDALAD
ncbi:MAG: hypothetical protein K2F84_08040, partial [Bacteroidales bacterium]|nr:hypothetical protein [Bacteroidales bacterium]